ncbi:hypothetical protein AMECASPLE_037576 [Ameca splendens]|uniref:Uncharacterized protein n=1 Tax=Ameca splendens TaxID=208324 RepID=A0ABV1A456_9TELE
MAYPAAPSRPASRSTNAKTHPNHCRTLSGQDPPTSRQIGHRRQKLGSKKIQMIPREQKRQPRHGLTPIPDSQLQPRPQPEGPPLLLAFSTRHQMRVWKHPKPTSACSNVVLMHVVVECI